MKELGNIFGRGNHAPTDTSKTILIFEIVLRQQYTEFSRREYVEFSRREYAEFCVSNTRLYKGGFFNLEIDHKS